MQEHTFIIQGIFKSSKEYLLDADENIQLMDVFADVVAASRETGNPIPTTRRIANGEAIEILWSFAWSDPSDDVVEELAPHLSLKDQGVLPGAEIIVSDKSLVGSGAYEMSNRERIIDDRRHLQVLVDRNSLHLKIVKASPRTIDLVFTDVRAIVGVDEKGIPTYGKEHGVRLLLPASYPYDGPSVVPLTPIFHPNIRVAGAERSACYAEEYRPDGHDTLSSIVQRYVSMIQYRQYNLQEPHRNMNEAASRWLEERLKDRAVELPVKPLIKIRAGESVKISLRESTSEGGAQ